tara:strand:+ start:212 stop:337 length:126 start_codon:yes stop_codon:yes gene_type:complete
MNNDQYQEGLLKIRNKKIEEVKNLEEQLKGKNLLKEIHLIR